MFKKDDYIVTLVIDRSKIAMPINGDTMCAREYYCFKQRNDYNWIAPKFDLDGSSSNSNQHLRFDKSNALIDWRYATNREIKHYNKVNKPYDTREIEISSEYLLEDLDQLEEKYK